MNWLDLIGVFTRIVLAEIDVDKAVFGSEALSEIPVLAVLPVNIKNLSPEFKEPVLELCHKLILLYWCIFFTVIVLTLVSPPCSEMFTFSWHHWIRVTTLFEDLFKGQADNMQSKQSPYAHVLEMLQTMLLDISSKFLESEMPSLYNLSAMNCKFSCVLHWHVFLSHLVEPPKMVSVGRRKHKKFVGAQIHISCGDWAKNQTVASSVSQSSWDLVCSSSL